MYKKIRQVLGIILVVAIIVTIGMFSGCKSNADVPETDVSEEEVSEPSEEEVAGENEEAIEEDVVEEEAAEEEIDLGIEVVDGLGDIVTMESPVEKVIVFAPSALEVIDAIGGMSKVIGVDNWSVENEEPLVEGFEGFGDFQGLNIEKIIEASPDLIISLAGGPVEDYERVNEFGVAVYIVDVPSLERCYEEIVNIGIMLGLEDDAAKIKDDFETQVNEIYSKVKDLDESEKPKVFYEIFDDPLWSTGSSTFIDDLITKAGGINIVSSDGLEGYVEYSVEKLIENDPDIMIAGDGGMYSAKTEDVILDDVRFSSVSAVINERVYIVPENSVVRPNHNTIKGLMMFAKAIHPEIFGEFEIVE